LPGPESGQPLFAVALQARYAFPSVDGTFFPSRLTEGATGMLEQYEQLKSMVASIEDDIRKAAGGNKAAGTRVRKGMQDIKNLAQELRKKVLESRESEQGAA
jgi:hypothetical protein